jgi:MFS family permease
MIPIGVMTFVTAATGSYARAGWATAATSLGAALGAPAAGMLADRFGQRPVLLTAVAVNVPALVAVALLPIGPAVLLALCVAVGLSLPPVGPLSRTRWFALAPGDASAAMAYEGTADEAAFVLGPATVGIIGTLWSPRAGLLVAAGLVATAVSAFAVHPTHPGARTARTVPRRQAAPRGRAAPALAVAVPAAGTFLMGMFFAAVQTGVNAFAARAALPSSGGLLYALLAVGSAATALSMAAVPATVGLRARCVVSVAGLVLGAGAMGMVAMGGGRSLSGMILALLFAGLWVGPTLVTLNTLAGRLAPPGRVATAMTTLSAASVLGIALGAVTGGRLVQRHGPAGAFGLAGTAAILLLAIAATADNPAQRG